MSPTTLYQFGIKMHRLAAVVNNYRTFHAGSLNQFKNGNHRLRWRKIRDIDVITV